MDSRRVAGSTELGSTDWALTRATTEARSSSMDSSDVESMVVVVEERRYQDGDSDSDRELNMRGSVSLAVTPQR